MIQHTLAHAAAGQDVETVSGRNGFDKGECRAAEMDPPEIGNLRQNTSENRFTAVKRTAQERSDDVR